MTRPPAAWSACRSPGWSVHSPAAGAIEGGLNDRPTYRIALNATSAVTGGGVTYWLNLLPALAALGRGHEFTVFLPARAEKLRIEPPSGFRFVRLDFGRPVTPRRMLWEQLTLPRLLRRMEADVLLAPADMGPLACPCPMVLAIRNLNPYSGPRASTRRERWREGLLRRLTAASARRAGRVFFVSEDSRRIISPQLGLPPEKTSVIYHGVGGPFLARVAAGGEDSGGRRGRYLLCVSVVRNHKDHVTLIKAFAALRARPGLGDLGLRIVGAVIDPAYHATLLRLVAELGLEEAVAFEGEVPYDRLPGIYRGAALFVLPSLAETFGHPLVEAMASGAPVVVTDLPVTREVCGGAATYFGAGDVPALAAGMAALLSDEGLRRRRIADGVERALVFSWERCARETLDLLEACARDAAQGVSR